jgi:hypothetical protein
MLAAHESQREWLKRQHGIDDPIQIMDRWTRARGKLAGIDYGEGFRRYGGHPFPDTPLLEDLLGNKAIRPTDTRPRGESTSSSHGKNNPP